MKNYNESELQEAGRRLVEREVFCRQNSTIELYQQHDPDFWDGVTNADDLKCPECGEAVDNDPDVLGAPDDAEHGCSYQCPHCGEGFEDAEQDAKEVYEWWAVSSWLADKLAGYGECIWDGPDVKVWGRCTTGQAIAIDHVIRRLVIDLGWVKPEGE